jgi:signal transduction histidine kinase
MAQMPAPGTFSGMQARAGDVARILGLAALYVAFARLGFSLGPVAGFATLVWPPTGISIAALLIFGSRLWPGIFVGAVAANILTDASVGIALGIAVGNTAEALIAAYLVRRLRRFSITLENVRSVTRLILAALIGPLVSASVGVACLYAGGRLGAWQLRETWRAWWIGDLVGALVVAPVILVWSRPVIARFTAARGEPAALAGAVALVSVATFFGDVPIVSALPAGFRHAELLLVVLVWAALRFGQRGAATVAFGISTTAVTATVLGHGPFVQTALSQSLMSLQTFIAIVAVTFLLFGATIDERRCALGVAREAHRAAALANRVKSEFLAVMSHELRTPLNAIAGYAQLLEDGVYGPLNGKQADGVARIRRNEQRLLGLIDEVLGFVSAEKGQLTVRRQPVRVWDAFDAVQPLIAGQLAEHHCILKRAAIGPRLAVNADPKSLQQILMRLLSNASKYSNGGGTVTMGAEREGDRVRIWVRDMGVGIPRQELDRVFEPFFQAEHAATRRFAGIGLGLTIARNLARRMDGEVTLSSEPGRGTTASVLLPAA